MIDPCARRWWRRLAVLGALAFIPAGAPYVIGAAVGSILGDCLFWREP
jgi:hypothetical protein